MTRFLLPPVNRAMTILDRSFFQKTFPITVARVFDPKNVGKVQRECVEDVLTGYRAVRSVTSEQDSEGKKQMLVRLKPNVKYDYENWGYNEIVEAILPEELGGTYPNSSTRVGHIVHFNLQNKFLPYKHLLAAVVLDKHPEVTTVVNKIEAVGSFSDFRTFPMELLAGSQNTKVTVCESDCNFHFDFAKVYWNSRLTSEHQRMIRLFKPGEAVADVMAGVGPFTVPAAKKHVIVFANDLNPDAYASLKENISINRVNNIAQPFNLDAREFIRTSIRRLLRLSRAPSIINNSAQVPRYQYSEKMQHKLRSLGKTEDEINPAPVYIRLPPTFSHFIMNNPSTAASYLDAFIGAYHGLEYLYFNADNSPKRELPLVHMYIFLKLLKPELLKQHICKIISNNLKHRVRPEDLEHLEQVKMVGPEKFYYCASFRLPAEVMFADVPPPKDKKKEDLNVRNWLKWSKDDEISHPALYTEAPPDALTSNLKETPCDKIYKGCPK